MIRALEPTVLLQEQSSMEPFRLIEPTLWMEVKWPIAEQRFWLAIEDLSAAWAVSQQRETMEVLMCVERSEFPANSLNEANVIGD
jgi:hypothetical protein